MFSAILAAVASFRASNKSAATAHEVGELTTRTSKEVAEIASQTAKELNKSTYKNDFYKMIIDNRLKAWKGAEVLIGLINRTATNNRVGGKMFSYFANADEVHKVLNAITAFAPQVFWMGQQYSNALGDYHKKLLSIGRECTVMINSGASKGTTTVDYDKVAEAGVKYHAEITDLLFRVMRAQAQQIITLHDVEAFFAQVAEIGLPEVVEGD